MADNGAPLLLLTRPRAQSMRFAKRLPGGLEVQIAPLMQIVPIGALPPLEGITDLIFTSENAVDRFADLSPRRDLRAWCVGPRTQAAARAIGLETREGGGTAEALFDTITGAKPETRFLHLHGHHTRGRLAARLTQAGINTQGCAIYDQRATDPPPLIADLAGARRVLAPVFSPRSALLLARAIDPEGSPENTPQTGDWHPLCLSPAIRDQLPLWLQKHAKVADSPTGEAMISLIKANISP